MVAYRLKMAPTLVSSLWLTAWQEAGRPDLNALMHPGKPGKDEKEKLSNELVAWKKNTLPQDQLLLAQQKTKKVETVDEIKSARDVTESTTDSTAPAPAAAPSATPGLDKLKIKTKGKDGTEKIKQKGDAPK